MGWQAVRAGAGGAHWLCHSGIDVLLEWIIVWSSRYRAVKGREKGQLVRPSRTKLAVDINASHGLVT